MDYLDEVERRDKSLQKNTPKEFEQWVVEELTSYVNSYEDELTGKCVACPASELDSNKRSCIDLYGEYNGVSFVVDTKLYKDGCYISGSDVAKLITDKAVNNASRGFLISFNAKLSSDRSETLRAANCFHIKVKGNRYWTKHFAQYCQDEFANE